MKAEFKRVGNDVHFHCIAENDEERSLIEELANKHPAVGL